MGGGEEKRRLAMVNVIGNNILFILYFDFNIRQQSDTSLNAYIFIWKLKKFKRSLWQHRDHIRDIPDNGYSYAQNHGYFPSTRSKEEKKLGKHVIKARGKKINKERKKE